jgi:hypothetical protein
MENTFTGKLTINNFGNGFVNCDNNDVIFISKKDLNFALNNNIVSGIIKEKTDKGYIGVITSNSSFVKKVYMGKVHHIFKDNVYIYPEKIDYCIKCF